MTKRCRARVGRYTQGAEHTKRCTNFAGEDGYCAAHRPSAKPAPCRVCWAANPPRGTTCDQHADQAGTYRAAG